MSRWRRSSLCVDEILEVVPHLLMRLVVEMLDGHFLK
jgi:hypothetical protein